MQPVSSPSCVEHKYCRYGERLKERTKMLKEINHKSGTQQALGRVAQAVRAGKRPTMRKNL